MEKIVGVEVLASAEAELLEAVSYYNEQSEGLGFDLAAEVLRTIERIVRYPLAWASLSKRTRRCRTNRFPFGVIYQIRKDQILIISIMHMKRHPDSWRIYLTSRRQ
jgi:ParE toxin of type II toxin-antitoxin system, parDE